MAQPQQTFSGDELYPSLAEKAAALGFFLIRNHPFIDGNKRVGHAALEVMLLLNGYELDASVDEQEQMILAVASGEVPRESLRLGWLSTCDRRPERAGPAGHGRVTGVENAFAVGEASASATEVSASQRV